MESVDREYVEAYPINWGTLEDMEYGALKQTLSHRAFRSVALYLHVPFCPQLCAFCGFNVTLYDSALYRRYVGALRRELSIVATWDDWYGRTLDAVYIGGGTATMLLLDDVARILSDIHRLLPVNPLAEISIEGFPNTMTQKRLVAYRRAGVNRVSIGLQSLNPDYLEFLGRAHTFRANGRAVELAREAGFDRVAVDVMYRFPGQTEEDLVQDVAAICALGPDSISAYSLIVDGSPLEVIRESLPTEDADFRFFQLLGESLIKAGYERFAQPDWAIPGRACRYVEIAWQAPQGLLIGLGPGAQTHYFAGHSWVNVYSTESYVAALERGSLPVALGTAVPESELPHRFVVLGARCGFLPDNTFRSLFSQSMLQAFPLQFAALMKKGWIESTPAGVTLTNMGLYFVDNISKMFYSEPNRGAPQAWARGLSGFVPTRFIAIPEA